MSIVVYKVGGSLTESVNAKSLLLQLRGCRDERVIVVPGGGVFSDAVREAQRVHQFSENAAHHMALLAMRCMARMLTDMVVGYEMADDEASMHACWARGVIPIWSPEHMVLSDTSVDASWDVTSDSLAAWLTARLNASRLVLVKSCAVPPDCRRDAKRLVALGIVDRAFERYVESLHCDWEVLPLDIALQNLARYPQYFAR